ncbi:hypothetical protein POM88_044379 [Heracleum sosnowskyi]|uniref:Uncharacterized protein n=1 Tax=Heracleum sosnowskyi TaxID=360622 RepID=A0AAD8H5A8_9APIA|nr:hypothetical protein POM88_044379 [Heracleum sosnowskyi]
MKTVEVNGLMRSDERVSVKKVGEAAAPQLCTFALGVLDKDTQTLKIVPITSNKRGFFESAYGTEISSRDPYEDDNFMETSQLSDKSMMTRLFAEAVKAPLLSSDSQVQTAILT